MAINRRYYNDYGTPRNAAAVIIAECVECGTSKGWAGNEEFYEVEKICNQFNVYYTCDFTGEWSVKNNK